MAKTYIDTVKYLIYTNVEIDGLVEKPDVVGAIFGQTEGLLGDELDLRDLQKNGRIGRIEVDLNGRDGKTTGIIKIPSSLDMVETCIIAAALETVDRVGPCEAKLLITKVEDTRSLKRKVLVDRAKSLLRLLLNTEIPESKEISETVRDEVKTAEIVEYGHDRLPAGPLVDKNPEVVFVEGRADVINLLKNDITNVVAIGGAKVTRTIIELSKKKEVTVFLDGDRGGDIILNELSQSGVDIDYVSRAPAGMEVEELKRKEIIKYLRNRIPFEQSAGGGGSKKIPLAQLERRKVELPKFKQDFEGDNPLSVVQQLRETIAPRETFREPSREPVQTREPSMVREPVRERRRPSSDVPPDDLKVHERVASIEKSLSGPMDLMKELDTLNNTLRARFYSAGFEKISEVPVRDVIKCLGETQNVHAIVFDGIITQRLADLASRQGVKMLVGLKIGNVNKAPENLEILTKMK
ncbi:DNA primase [Candidatus Micrarchaeota archaeon]|nr:DNA primase [Candidatus Micrarchaeota archaeon]